MPQLAQILLGGQHDAMAAFGIARLVDHEDAAGMWTQHRMGLLLLQATAVERLSIPGGIMQEVMQHLPARTGDDRGQLH